MTFRMLQLASRVPSRLGQMLFIRNASSSSNVVTAEQLLYYPAVGNREIVGYGRNGKPQYYDDTIFPYPSIRYKESSPEVLALQEKAAGDWKNMSVEEMRTIYRNNFCQTYSEIQGSTGRWKISLSWLFFVLGIAGWFFYGTRLIYPPLRKAFSDEERDHALYLQLYQRFNPVDGISSKFDYDNKRWK